MLVARIACQIIKLRLSLCKISEANSLNPSAYNDVITYFHGESLFVICFSTKKNNSSGFSVLQGSSSKIPPKAM